MDTYTNIKSNEIWLPIEGYEGIYDVSNYGRIYSYPRPRTKGGYSYGNYKSQRYCSFGLRKQKKRITKYIHILVYETFIGKVPEGYDVHHKNGNGKDNRLENLELIKNGEHQKKHLYEHLEKIINKCAKPVLQFTLDGMFVTEYESLTEASRQTGIKEGDICRCCQNKRKSAGGFIWKYK